GQHAGAATHVEQAHSRLNVRRIERRAHGLARHGAKAFVIGSDTPRPPGLLEIKKCSGIIGFLDGHDFPLENRPAKSHHNAQAAASWLPSCGEMSMPGA